MCSIKRIKFFVFYISPQWLLLFSPWELRRENSISASSDKKKAWIQTTVVLLSTNYVCRYLQTLYEQNPTATIFVCVSVFEKDPEQCTSLSQYRVSRQYFDGISWKRTMWCFVAVNSLGKTFPISIKANIAQYCQFLNFGVADGWSKQVAVCCSANKELPPECSCVRMILHGRLPSKPYLRSSATASFPYLCQRCCLALGGIKERPANTIIQFCYLFIFAKDAALP